MATMFFALCSFIFASVSYSQENVLEAEETPEFVQPEGSPGAQFTLSELSAQIEILNQEVHALKSEREEDPRDSNQVVTPGTVFIDQEQVVDHASSYGDDLVVFGRVRGNATAFGGDVRVQAGGTVEGNAVSFGGRVLIDRHGQVIGNRVAIQLPPPFSPHQSSGPLHTPSPQAGPSGNQHSPPARGGPPSPIFHTLLFFLSFSGLGIIALGLIPNRITRVAREVKKRPIWSAFLGLTGSIMAVGASILFALLVIGLPISLILIALWSLAWLFGLVALSKTIGEALPFVDRVRGDWLGMLIGMFILTLTASIPYVGVPIGLCMSSIGIGATMTTLLGSR